MQTLTRPHHRFNANQFPFSLWRLSDEEYSQFRLRSFPIQGDSFFLIKLSLSQQNTPEELTLPKVLLVLEDEFGRSSTSIDTYKQTFLFPFLLAIEKPSGTFYHLLRIEDYRGGLEFNLFRIVDEIKYAQEKLEIVHQPIEEELSLEEIKYLICYLWGYLKGSSEAFCKSPTAITPFFRHVDSIHVIYGYWDGKFIEEVIDDTDEYQRKVRDLEARFGESSISNENKVLRIREMIESTITVTTKSHFYNGNENNKMENTFASYHSNLVTFLDQKWAASVKPKPMRSRSL